MEPFTVAIIGAGSRGKNAYSPEFAAHPEWFRVVAVAEPIRERREAVQKMFSIPAEMCFHDDQEFFSRSKMCHAVLIATQDAQHYAMAHRAIELGYHIMLEKPISPSIEECEALLKQATEAKTDILICHVLRYTAFYSAIKDLLKKKTLGELVNINYQEDVGYWHFAHSFVRGNWRREDESSPLILAKCCHDMDMLQYLLDAKLESVSASGSLKLFKKENAPEGAPDRCIQGCPYAEECAFNAEKVYLTDNTAWPCDVISEDLSLEGRRKALLEGPYGRCVYKCDNDVVDHHLALMHFSNGVDVTFTVSAFNNICERVLHFMGTKGELTARMSEHKLEINLFRSGVRAAEHITIPIPESETGHDGGDSGVIAKWYKMQCENAKEPKEFAQAVHSHRMAHMLEQARITGRIIKYNESVK